MIKDDCSGFLESSSAGAPDHFPLADVLVDWYSRFAVCSTDLQNQQSHFKDKVINQFNQVSKIKNHLRMTCYSLG